MRGKPLAGGLPGSPGQKKSGDFAPGLPVANMGRPGDLRSYTVHYSDSVMRAKNIRSGWIAGLNGFVSKY